MTYETHHRRSIRLKGFDYSSEGLFFITICLQDRECLFGEAMSSVQIRDQGNEGPRIILNDAAKMAARWYYKLPEKYPDKLCHEMVVMPNHVHFIIENVGTNPEGAHVGAPFAKQ